MTHDLPPTPDRPHPAAPGSAPIPGGAGGSAAGVLDGLNPQQAAAVTHRGGPLLIVAGAGSGKTSVLTRRIAHLLAVGGAHPGQILAITFTNKAAAEMRERVAAVVGPAAERMWVATFHSVCVRILRAQSALLDGRGSGFTIYDADDSRRLLGMIAREQELDVKKFTPRMLASSISALKNELVGPDEAIDRAERDSDRVGTVVAGVYREYQGRLRAANAFDFDDLIGETVALLRDHPEVAGYYRRRFRHVLVDEYQDTNHAQYVLIRTIVGGTDDAAGTASSVPPAELCVVGDADQSIYAFRGATIRNIEDFESDYPQARAILLEQNYRSTQTILTAANAVIARNAGRREKKLWTDADGGDPISGYVADNEHDEARFVAAEIDRLVDSGEYTYGDIAVFYRTNNSSRVLEDVFVRLGLPYKVVGGTRFYERKEVRDVVAYLKAMVNPEDAVALRRVLNTPRRGIGDRTEACLVAHAEQRGIGFGQALRDAAEGRVPMLGTRSVKPVAAFVQMMDRLRDRLYGADHAGGERSLPDIGELVEAVLDATGYRAELESSNDPQDAARLDNLNELVGVAREFSSAAALTRAADEAGRPPEGSGAERGSGPGSRAGSEPGSVAELEAGLDEGLAQPGSLEAFLERVSLVADADEIPDDAAGMVTMMTLHTAKGLEFPVVFLVGMEDGLFPHMRALGDPAELAEERRLAYVGITRARRRLYLSRAMMRSSWGQPMTNPASRFLEEVPQDVMDWLREEPAGMSGGEWGVNPRRFHSGGSAAGFGGGGSAGSAAGRVRARTQTLGPALDLVAGDRVTHDKYGLGKVLSCEKIGDKPLAVIDFGTAGTMRLMLVGGVPMQKL